MTKKTEGRVQSECVVWLWNNYPETRGLLCYNLNNSKNEIDGARNKSLGLIKGRSDLVFYWLGKATMIEMKDEDDGEQSEDQRKWQRRIEAHGFEYCICRSLEDFKKILLNLMGDAR